MSMKEAALLGLEEVLGRVLSLDEQAAARLAGLHGRVIGLEILGLGIRLYFIPGESGGLQVLPSVDGEPDCLMRGAPLDLLATALTPRKEDALFAHRLEIRGDTDLAQRFSEVLSGLDIDWEEELSKLVGDIPAHEAGKRARAAGRWADRTGHIAGQDLREYLQEEIRLLPTRYEVEEWQNGVDLVRDDVERMAARVARLERLLRPGGDK